jgi:FkbM family methyltransferase
MSGVLQRALHHPRVEPAISAGLRGRLVRESAGFTVRELRGAGSSHVYRIRESGLRALIKHGTPDVLTLDQAFYQHVYEPPHTVAAALESTGRPLRAVDLGANIGLWGLWLHGRFSVGHLTAVEPDPENAAKHRRQIELNGLEDSWDLLQAAATCAEQPVLFTIGRATTGRIGESGDTGTVEVAAVDSFSLLDGVDLLKIDIEGAEWAILGDPRFAAIEVPVVMLEYHPRGAPTGDPEGDAVRALAGAGYDTVPVHGAPDGTGIVWALRA